MKHILLILILFASCQKEEPTPCKTCDEKVHLRQQGQQNLDYVQSSKEYCNGEWGAVEGKVVRSSGTNHSGWWEKTVITECR